VPGPVILRPAGVDKILITTSNPSKNKIRRAMKIRKPHPQFIQAVDEEPGMDYAATSDEFGSIRFSSPPTKDYKIGDKLEVIVPHCDPVVNEYDQMYGIRKDRVEVIWDITARGKSP
jgi:D-serine deaminase-like pyridoxal phosphate-dependent protein